MRPYNPREVLEAAPRLVSNDDTTREDVAASLRTFGRLGRHLLGGRRFTGVSPWERHPHDDELLVVTDGAVEVTLLAPEGDVIVALRAGDLFVVPAGLWHRSHARDGVTMWGATAVEHDEISFADDPRSPS